jgi:hypothetical protein
MGFITLDQVGPDAARFIQSQVAPSEFILCIYEAGRWVKASYLVLTNQRVLNVANQSAIEVPLQQIESAEFDTFDTTIMRLISPQGSTLSLDFKTAEDAAQFQSMLTLARGERSHGIQHEDGHDGAKSGASSGMSIGMSSGANGAALLARIQQLIELNDRGSISDADLKRLLKEEIAQRR